MYTKRTLVWDFIFPNICLVKAIKCIFLLTDFLFNKFVLV